MKITLPLLLILTSLLFTSCSKNDPEPTAPFYVDDDLAGPISRPQKRY